MTPHESAAQRFTNWRSTFCECFDDPLSCCEVFFFSCCQVKAQTVRLRTSDNFLCDGALCCTICCSTPTCCLDICFESMVNRRQIRKEFGIEGSECGDFCVTCTCCCCALAQQHREMTARGMWPGGVCLSPPPLPPHNSFPPMRSNGNSNQHIYYGDANLPDTHQQTEGQRPQAVFSQGIVMGTDGLDEPATSEVVEQLPPCFAQNNDGQYI